MVCREKLILKFRQIKYLNNIIEQDHRRMKQLCRSTLGFQTFKRAKVTLAGFECMKRFKKELISKKDKFPAENFCALMK